jgi:hypothetical protein
VNALLARTLRLDLSRMTGRRLERVIAAASMQTIPPVRNHATAASGTA